MPKRVFVRVFVCLAAAGSLLPIQSSPKEGQLRREGVSIAAPVDTAENYARLPLSFETNQGQVASEVKFLSRGDGYTLFLTSTEAVLSLKNSRDPRGSRADSRGAPENNATVLRMKLAGSNPQAEVAGMDELAGKSNYFIGNDPSQWRTNISTYAKVGYKNVYPGIDLVYYGNQRELEYDFVVAPGADPRHIRLAIQSDDREASVPPRIDSKGDLVVEADGSELRLHRPIIYQEISGARQSIDGDFVIQGNREISFEVALYDTNKPLIIDPVLSYSTYLGGSSIGGGFGEFSYAIAVDSAGNANLTGDTQSSDFPTANAFNPVKTGFSDVFVTKLNAAGSALIYSTYLGGASGETGFGIAVDSSGNAYVTGSTGSTNRDGSPGNANFPTTGGAFQSDAAGTTQGDTDAFVTKFSPSGSLIYSSFLGGVSTDSGYGIAVDSSGNAYVTGETSAQDFPTTMNAFDETKNGFAADAFVTKINAAGSALLYSTYLGGSIAPNASTDSGRGIAVDSSGNAYVTGFAATSDFPTTPSSFDPTFNGGDVDAFVTKLDAAGSALVYSAFLGGGSNESARGIAVDSAGNAYVTGYTSSADFPKANPFKPVLGGSDTDAFVTKVNSDGSTLAYSTFLGGSSLDEGWGIAVDSTGSAYVTGRTTSSDFPTANPFQATFGGGTQDAFVTKFDAAGSAPEFSSYLGGSLRDWGYGLAADSAGNAYVTGNTTSTNFPTANAYQGSNHGGFNGDVFITKAPTLDPPPGRKIGSQITSQ